MSEKFDIPEPMRDFAEKSVDHARKAFEDYIASAQKAVGTFESSAADAQENARAFGETAISFAEENMAASFDFAKRIVNATSIDDMLKIQADFVERQMETFSKQGRDLAGAAGAADDKSPPDGDGKSAGKSGST